ncbi:odorant receptor 49b-like [Bombus pascuorum]|uniref:odorant receptor 49b-like n=1 Tax=Bombus pascuorum TaxID=65598 RepID=UPI00214642B7|nr:odorant receptor 49b-like [Bombus pascuorum]
MFRNVTPETAITFTQFILGLSCCWPLPSTATKSQILCFKILRSVLFLNSLLLFCPLLYAIYMHREDTAMFCKSVSLALAVVHVPLHSTYSFSQHDRYQRLIEEMKSCCEKGNSYERQIFQRYVDKYAIYYAASAVWFYWSPSIILIGTFFISDPFPTNAEYPFPVDFEPVRSIIFLQQSLVGMQCASLLCTNILCALLLLFAAARFEILMTEIRTVNSVKSLIKCVKKYYTLKRYAEEVANTARYTTLITLCICGVESVFAGIIFIGRQPFAVKLQFVTVSITVLLAVFMCAWPADNLIDVSESTMRTVYESKWYEQPLRIQKFILFMMIPQSPVILRIRCIIPAFSLNYYCSFITNVLSMFTALRVVMFQDEDAILDDI